MENQNAGQQPVEKTNEELNNNETAPVVDEKVELTKTELDNLIKTAEEATALAQKKAEDAENYKKGMLKYKGKLTEAGLEEVEEKTVDKEEINQIVAEAVKNALAEVKPEVDKTLEESNALKLKVEEMRNVLANRPSAPLSAGSNLDKVESNATEATKFFSPEQIAEMKTKYPNIDISEVIKNLPKAGDMKGAPNTTN
jgi:hypothetical protein